MPGVMKGNKREVPGGMPPFLWFERRRKVEATVELGELPFYHDVMEYLSPAELRRFRAKYVVWVEVVGKVPDDYSCWWEVRQARKRRDLPWPEKVVASQVDAQGVLHCGGCGARWSPSFDGGDFPDRCKLCGAIMRQVSHQLA